MPENQQIDPRQKAKLLFDAASAKYNLGDFDEFYAKLQDNTKRKALHEAIGAKFNLGTFEEFSNKVTSKKKEGAPLPLQYSPTESPSLYKELQKTSTKEKQKEEFKNLFGGVSAKPGTREYTRNEFGRLEETLARKAESDKIANSIKTGNMSQQMWNPSQTNTAANDMLIRSEQEALVNSEESNKLIAKLSPAIEAGITPFLGQFSDKGFISDEKIDKFAKQMSEKLGGGSYVKEFVRGVIKNKEEAAIFEKKVEKFLPDELKKATALLSGKTQKVGGVDVPVIEGKSETKSVAEFAQEQVKKLANEKATLIFKGYKPKVDEIRADFKKDAAEINEVYKTLTAAAKTPEEQELVYKEYLTSMNGIQSKANRRIQRITDELNKQLNAQLAQLELPEESKKAIQEAYFLAAKKAEDAEVKTKLAIQEAQRKAIGLTGLFGKSIYSSLLTGLASRGDALVGLGLGGDFADWLRTFRQGGEMTETVDLPLDGANWLKPEAYLTRLGKQLGYQLPGMIATAATANPFIGGMIGFIDEQSQNAGEVYNQILSETLNPVLAKQATVRYLYRNIPSIPLYFLEANMFLKYTGIKKGNVAAGIFGEIPIEVFQEGYQGYTGQLDYKSSKSLGSYLKEDFPNVAFETAVTTVLQNAMFAGGGAVAKSLLSKKTTPEQYSRNYVYNLLADKGLNAARMVPELNFQNGRITEQELFAWKEELMKLNDTITQLRDTGLSEDQIKGYLSILSKRDLLQKIVDGKIRVGDGRQMPKELTPEIKQAYQEEIEKLNEELKKAALGNVASTTIIFPSGGSVTLTDDEAKSVADEIKEEIGVNVDVTSTEADVNKKVEEIKQKTPQQINDDFLQQMSELQSEFLDNGIEVVLDDSQNILVRDMNGQPIDVDVLPDELIQKVNEYKSVIEKIIASEKEEEQQASQIKEFVSKISQGEKLSSPEDLQFYENNKKEIEEELKKLSKAKPPSAAQPPAQPKNLSISNVYDVVSSLERLRAKQGTELETTITQMMTITDQMAEIEKEFAKQGFILDTDYDTVVIRKEGKAQQDFTEPDDLPEGLRDLAAQYEMAFLELLGFDEQATGIALQRSRGVTEDVEYEEVSTAKGQKRSEIDGERLSNFKQGDIVYTNWNGKYVEYEIVSTKGDLWKLKDSFGYTKTFNAANNGGFILKEAAPKAETPKAEPKAEPPSKGASGMLMVRSINELKAEIELLKQGKDTQEKRLKIAEFEKEIAEQERLGIPPNKGRTVSADEEVVGENPALKYETPILSTPKILSTDGLPDLEIVASKEAGQALESEIGGDKGVIDKNVRTIPIQEYDVASNKRSKQIAEQIKENGWVEPLIVSYDKNGSVYIVEGQHRAAALKEIGYDKAPVIVIHEKDLGKKSLKESPKAETKEQPKSETTKQPEFKEEAPISEVVNVPISEIKTNVKEYQGRKNKFSERSAANVAKNFDINKFDPIVVYKHPDGNTYVLSGHSRLEGMRRRSEKTIPARYFTGTPEEAKDFALKSNKLGTLQTDLENAGYYREEMLKGRSYSSLMAEAKENEQEGTASRIMDYAMLNPKGKAYQALEALESGESDSSTNIKIITQKVGRIRAKNEHLTDAHENELFDYFLANGFPTDKEINDPNNVINRSINAVKFNPAEPLNLKKVVTKSSERIEWERELSELQSKISELKKETTPDKKTGWTGLKEKIIAQLAKSKSQEAIDKAEKDFNNNVGKVKDIYEKKLSDSKKQLSVLQDKLAKHLLREKDLIEGEKGQKSLFDAIDEQTEQTEEEAENLVFYTQYNAQKIGQKITIPGFENLDFVAVQDGMNYDIHELGTGMQVSIITAFTIEEAIEQASQAMQKFNENQLLDSIYKKIKDKYSSNKIDIVNKSEKLEKYISQREKEEKEKDESLPYLHSDQERQMILAYAEQAKAEGLDVYKMLETIANYKEGKYSGNKITEQRVVEMISNARKKKETEKQIKNQEPLTFKDKFDDSENAFKDAINSTYKTDKYSEIPSEIRRKMYEGFKKEMAIRNKYGYYPEKYFANVNGATLVLGKYAYAMGSKKNKEENIKEEENNINEYLKFINEVYEIEFPAQEAKAKPKQDKTEKRKVRDEKLRKDIDSALDDLFGSGIPLMSFGIDSEKLERGVKVISLYTKAGIYKFMDIAEDLYAKYGDNLKNIIEEIKAIYAYYRIRATKEERDKMDVDVADITFEEVAMRMQESDPKDDFIESVMNNLRNNEKQNIVSLRKLAEENGLEIEDKELQEYVELAIINVAREISSNKELTEQEKFDKIKELYEIQPTISMRSSERIEKQQYSTPVPISFTAGMFTQTGGQKTFLDPSAGNGMLLINSDGSVIANEIDKTRAENLEKQGFQVFNYNAEEPLPFKVDSILTNPPFGERPKKQIKDYSISGLAPQMAINALNNMKDEGTAAIIVGGNSDYDDRGVLKGGDRPFLNYLYDNYDVIDVINIDGNLYRKQGTSFPVRLILIGGRRTDFSAGDRFAPLKDKANAESVKSFDELYNRVKTAQNELLLLQKVRKYELGQVTGGTPSNVGRTDEKRDSGKDTGSQKPVQDSRGLAISPNISDRPGGTVIRDTEQLGSKGYDERVGGEPTNKVNIQKVQTGEGELGGVSGGIDQRIKEIEQSENIPYTPGSAAPEIGSVVPVNMATGMKGVLSQFPDVDEYVRERLGYDSKEELFSYLSAEQIDGVAIAISQIENNKAVIIGDMTGVGKGRQAAAIIRYAVRAGYKPIFMTEKANLFSDIYRDLIDIGSGDLKPFIVNDASPKSDPSIKVDDGTGTGNFKILHKPLQRKDKAPVYNSGKIPDKYDFVLTTYSQLAQEKAKEKRGFFARISSGNVLIMDESHNASGTGNTGQFLQSVLPTTKGATFLSATYSKNPDTMPVYGTKTSISDANMSQQELISAIKNGGAVLQEIMAKQLTEIGEYIRRERDFTGVTTTWETAGESPEEKEKIIKTFDDVASILRDIIAFQKVFVTPAINQMNEELKNSLATAGITKGTEEVGISNTPFASKVFNITRQLMFSLKAEKVAEAVIEEIENNNKVVVAVSSTMEGFLEDLDFEDGIISDVDYTIALQKALTGVMRYSVNTGKGNSQKYSLNISDLSPEGQSEFRRISKKIKEITTGITISPIDIIKSRIQEAGYSVAEITGRSNQITYEEGKAIKQKRKTDKKEAEIGFTGGKLKKGEKPTNKSKYDVILLNQSGSTGISLHASETFRDQRPRVMIMAQMQLDVNTEIQVRGRIDRTGQVHRGRYRYMLSPVPAEQRLAMMFIKKLKSLSANTSGTQETKEDKEIVDFLNKYGDEKVVEYLKENTEINDALFDPLKISGLSEEERDKFTKYENAASKVSGRVAILPVAQQQDFYNEIASRYVPYIETLDENNENDLKIKIINLKAKTLQSNVIIEGKNNKNPFSSDSILEEVEMDNTKFPLFKKEIDKQIADKLSGKTEQDYKQDLIDLANEYTERKVSEEIEYAEKSFDEKLTEIQTTTNIKLSKAVNEEDVIDIKEEAEKLEDELRERYEYLKESRENRVRQRQSRVISYIKRFNVGGMFLVPVSLKDPQMGSSPGVFIGFTIRGKNLTPSNISARFAVLDARRTVDVPLSQTEFLDNVNKGLGMTKLENWDEERKVVKSRRKGYIITGNILQAANFSGKIIKYTTEDGQIKDGILMPDNLDVTKMLGGVLVSADKAYDTFINTGTIVDSSGEITIKYESGKINIYVPKSKAEGGKYFLNEKLRALVDNNNFKQQGNKFVGTLTRTQGIQSYGKELFNLLGKEFNTKFMIPAEPKPLAKQTAPSKTITQDKYNSLVERLNKAFPGVKIISEQKQGGQEIRTAQGVVYGMTYPDGTIYLNPDALNAETPIHEFSHIWESAFPEEWKKGIEMMKESKGFKKALAEVQSNPFYKNLTEAEQRSEALNLLVGRKGETYFQNEALAKFKAWLRNLFVKISDKLGLGNLISPDTRLEQFTDRVVKELLGGKVLSKKPITAKKPRLMAVPSDVSDVEDFDDATKSKSLIERQRKQYEFMKKYGQDKFKKLNDITRNFGNYVKQLEDSEYIKDKIC